MNILSIGNSYSQDAHRYLHEIAKADGVSLSTVNLYIGGCPLNVHYRNMLSGERAYELEVDGHLSFFKVSLKEALLNREWDYITIQQASHVSPDYEAYQPYLTELYKYVKKCAPKAQVVIHQTWAYAEGDERMQNVLGYKTQRDMFNALEKAYDHAARDIGGARIIRSGELLQELINAGITELHRDRFCHVTYGLGRYAVALLWYRFLTGNDVLKNQFNAFDEEITPENIETVKKCVRKMMIE